MLVAASERHLKMRKARARALKMSTQRKKQFLLQGVKMITLFPSMRNVRARLSESGPGKDWRAVGEHIEAAMLASGRSSKA